MPSPLRDVKALSDWIELDYYRRPRRLRRSRALLAWAVLLSGAGALALLTWLGQPQVAVCLLAGIGVGVTGSAAFGLAMPYALRLLQRDPQVAAGPIALVTADLLALSIYFSVARWLLG